jgi:hypothetical protein
MIKIPLTKILFFDIETVGGCKNYTECKTNNPIIAKQFENYFDWFQKRFPEDVGQSEDYVFEKRAALVPEVTILKTLIFQCWQNE